MTGPCEQCGARHTRSLWLGGAISSHWVRTCRSGRDIVFDGSRPTDMRDRFTVKVGLMLSCPSASMCTMAKDTKLFHSQHTQRGMARGTRTLRRQILVRDRWRLQPGVRRIVQFTSNSWPSNNSAHIVFRNISMPYVERHRDADCTVPACIARHSVTTATVSSIMVPCHVASARDLQQCTASGETQQHTTLRHTNRLCAVC
jgi:hypothetical protein